MTNKRTKARALLAFHNGRGSQEAIFAELKSQLQFDYIPTRRKVGNQAYALACCLAHNLSRALQMRTSAPARANSPKRACLWVFETIGRFRKRLIQRAGRLTRPHGRLTLTIAGDQETADEMLRYLSALPRAA